MHRANRPVRWGRGAVAFAVAAAMCFSAPTAALAASKQDLRSQMVVARDRIAELNAEAEACQYDLFNVRAELQQTLDNIDELDRQIPQTRSELEEAKGELAVIVCENYKGGVPTLLDVLVDATSFDDLVSRIIYANKVAAHERDVVNNVKELADKLDQQKSDLETERDNKLRLVDEQEQRLQAANDAMASAESYYAQLSGELQRMIEAEDAAARRQAAESARQGAAQAQARAEREAAESGASQGQAANATSGADANARGGEVTGDVQEGNEPASQAENAIPVPSGQEVPQETTQEEPAPESVAQPEPVAEPEPEPVVEPEPVAEPEPEPVVESEPEPEPEPVQVTAPSSGVSDMVARAYSIIGAAHSMSGYSWTGNVSDSWFTCSGVVDYARGMPSWSSSPESLYAEVGSRMVHDWTQLNYGDLVFYPYAGRYPGHVGIYIGDGQIIDSIPNGGVQIRNVNYMTLLGGGPIV